MNSDYCKPGCRVFCAAVLAWSLAACGEKPQAAAGSATIDSAVAAAAAQPKPAAVSQEQAHAGAAQTAADAKTAADTAMGEKVKAAILATPGLEHMAMDVRSAAGEVTLYGTADNNAQRSQAEKVAAGVPGVKSLKNKLLIVSGS